MTDPRIEKLAQLIVKYSVHVKKGESVQISAPIVAEPLALELTREVVRAGGYPLLEPYFDRTNEIFFEEASDDHIKYVSPYRKFVIEHIDVSIGIWADTNTKRMSNVDPAKLALLSSSRREINDTFHTRTGKGELRWVGMPYPTDAMAQDANMSSSEYERFVFSATKVDKRDPVAEWQKVKKEQEKMVKVLDKVDKLVFYGEDTELKMSVKGRKWQNCCGDKNMPDGEVFTGPIENSVEGKVRFTYPGIYMGKEIEDISLEFKKGKVVKAKATKGQELLDQLLKIDEGCKRLGEVAIGTNYGIKKFTKNMLFDEKIGGTVHMALGMGFPETKSKNKAPIHWDILKDMTKGGEITADGMTVYKNGKWVA